MALPRKPVPQPPSGFIASAVRLPAVRPNHIAASRGWQSRGWHWFNTIGEVRFISTWVGSMMSKAVLVPAKVEGQEYVPVDSGPAMDAISAYFGGPPGQAEMLRSTGIGHTVAGEVYHVLHGNDEWDVLTSQKISQVGGQIYLTVDGNREILNPDDLAIRVWTPHPVEIDEPDSPIRSNMGTLAELEQLNAHVLAQLDSRLTGAGILFIPSEIEFATPTGIDPNASQADVFMQTLAQAMEMGIKDRSSAAAMVPLVVTAPGESLDKVQHMTFWSQLDSAIIQMREHAVKRLAIGMDTPPEVLLGMGDSNHFSSWLVSEEAIKSHLEPRLQVVVNAITTAYLRPAIEGLVPDPENYVVLADTSKIRVRPNRSNEAIELYDRGVLNSSALRRETGFDPQDSMGKEELILWLLKKAAVGSTSPEQSIAALAKLGVDLGIGVPQEENRPPGDQIRIDSRRDADNQQQPDYQRSIAEKEQRDGLAAACEVLVYRALERAGNRLSNTRSDSRTTAPAQRYLSAEGANPDRLLQGTWDMAEEVLGSYCTNPGAFVLSLDMYVRGLLITRTPHTRSAMIAALTRVSV